MIIKRIEEQDKKQRIAREVLRKRAGGLKFQVYYESIYSRSLTRSFSRRSRTGRRQVSSA